jgi:hypothetical protein
MTEEFRVPFANHLHVADPQWTPEQVAEFNVEARQAYEKHFRCPYVYILQSEESLLEEAKDPQWWACRCDFECTECGAIGEDECDCPEEAHANRHPNTEFDCADCSALRPGVQRCTHTFDFLSRNRHLKSCRLRPADPAPREVSKKVVPASLMKLLCLFCARYYSVVSYRVHLRRCRENVVNVFDKLPHDLKPEIPSIPDDVTVPSSGASRSDIEAFNHMVQDDLLPACPWFSGCRRRGGATYIVRHMQMCSFRNDPLEGDRIASRSLAGRAQMSGSQTGSAHPPAPWMAATSRAAHHKGGKARLVFCFVCGQYRRATAFGPHLEKCSTKRIEELGRLPADVRPHEVPVVDRNSQDWNLLPPGNASQERIDAFNEWSRQTYRKYLPYCPYDGCTTIDPVTRQLIRHYVEPIYMERHLAKCPHRHRGKVYKWTSPGSIVPLPAPKRSPAKSTGKEDLSTARGRAEHERMLHTRRQMVAQDATALESSQVLDAEEQDLKSDADQAARVLADMEAEEAVRAEAENKIMSIHADETDEAQPAPTPVIAQAVVDPEPVVETKHGPVPAVIEVQKPPAAIVEEKKEPAAAAVEVKQAVNRPERPPVTQPGATQPSAPSTSGSDFDDDEDGEDEEQATSDNDSDADIAGWDQVSDGDGDEKSDPFGGLIKWFSKSSSSSPGKFYYVNAVTGETQWDEPEEAYEKYEIQLYGNRLAQLLDCAKKGLPTGWNAVLDEKHRIRYTTPTGETTAERP